MRYLSIVSMFAVSTMSASAFSEDPGSETAELNSLDVVIEAAAPAERGDSVAPADVEQGFDSSSPEATGIALDEAAEAYPDDEAIASALAQAEHIVAGGTSNGYTRTLVEGDFYAVVHPIEVEWAILQSLSREGVDVETDDRFSLASIRELAGAISTVCGDMTCVLEALATGYLETRWRPDQVGAAGECGWAQQTPAYAYELSELNGLSRRERCEMLQADQLIAVRQWYQKRQYWRERKGDRWSCYYNAGYICTAQGQFYMSNHRRYYDMYEQMFDHLVASDDLN